MQAGGDPTAGTWVTTNGEQVERSVYRGNAAPARPALKAAGAEPSVRRGVAFSGVYVRACVCAAAY